ncbi:hypothetical protein NC653_002170 [Populus alba x Populus x berolinensis]|uniref:Survival protein SurE-like phosphatase/nucleotidase domain-containing protein n=1 Tax=Populus alba x Populus x berolinensis TaxID=444605 RepID=A0AAD6RNW1_9ROSI|nr:hypothetical protein NC653_002170 [Populus alba x Populus x berolinensis]
MTSVKNNNMLPPGLVSNLQQVLLSRKGGGGEEEEKKEIDPSNDGNDKSAEPSTSTCVENTEEDSNNSKPIVLVTNGDGIDSLVLFLLLKLWFVKASIMSMFALSIFVNWLVRDKSVSSHSVTLKEAIAVTSVEINGAIAYEVSGNKWSNRGSNCGHHMIYSGVVAGAREALFRGVTSLSISLNCDKCCYQRYWKGVFSKSCSLNIEIPTSPSAKQGSSPALLEAPELYSFLVLYGFKLTKRSMWRSSPRWQAVSANRHPSAGHFMSNQQSLGLQLAQLSRDASDAFLDKELEDTDEDLDFRAVENGFVAIISTISFSTNLKSTLTWQPQIGSPPRFMVTNKSRLNDIINYFVMLLQAGGQRLC